MAVLKLNSDNTVGQTDVTDTITSALVTSGTMEFTLKDRAGNEVTGETWPLSLPYIEAGHFRGNLKDTLTLNTRLTYTGTFVYDDGPDKHREWCVTYTDECS